MRVEKTFVVPILLILRNYNEVVWHKRPCMSTLNGGMAVADQRRMLKANQFKRGG